MEYIIFFIMIGACAYQSFQIGIKEGCERTVRKLMNERIISIKLNGDIVPNKFFKH
jgi:hypothetical protein